MKKENKIDPDVYDLFIKDGLYQDYAKEEINPEQLDQ